MTTSEEYLEQLAAEWKQAAEEYRADLQVERDRSRAQAAVIERVRQWLLYSEELLPLTRIQRASDALAAAPEATAPDTPDEGESDLSAALARVEHETARADAANARVAELERECDSHVQDTLRLSEDLVAANDRAEAADRRAQSWERGHDYAWSEKQLAESEAEALRAQLAAANARADAAEWEVRTFEAALERAESEAAALRAELERLKARS